MGWQTGYTYFLKIDILVLIILNFVKGTCFGDSGGPFIVQKAGDPRFIQTINILLQIRQC